MNIRNILATLLGIVVVCSGIFFLKKIFFAPKQDDFIGGQLVVNMGWSPMELHPHFVRDVHSAILANHLYEGLFRYGPEGTLMLGLARDVQISEDKKTYCISLRESQWSDGSPLTSEDFIRSWRNAIAPTERACAGSMHFDFVEGVNEFKEGSSTWSEVAIKAEGLQKLIITLRHPVPYFLELLTLPIFSPVHADYKSSYFITNGPFKAKELKWGDYFLLEKNQYFWDSTSVKLPKIKFLFIEEAETQSILFEQGQLHFIGGGLLSIPQQSADMLDQNGYLSPQYDVSTHSYLLVNTLSGPFQSENIRHAFSMAINRDLLAQGLFKRSFPAFCYLPPTMSNRKDLRLIKESLTESKKLLQEGLDELEMSFASLGEVRLLCTESGGKLAQAIQQHWAENLGILISIETVEFKLLLSRLSEGEFDIAIAGSAADYRDPYTFFENFIHKEYSSNYTGWSPSYFRIMFEEGFQLTGEDRNRHIEAMEDYILSAMPQIPIAFGREVYAKHPKLKGVYVSELHMVDFSRAYWE